VKQPEQATPHFQQVECRLAHHLPTLGYSCLAFALQDSSPLLLWAEGQAVVMGGWRL